uniref:Uncharacterized protein n=1 Tax=Arundo donax TaxID=35708 RepID=A0A0A9H4Z0_ARUDO
MKFFLILMKINCFCKILVKFL